MPELKNAEVVSVTTKELDLNVEQRVVFKTEQTSTQVVTIVNKETQKVTVVDKSPVDSTQLTTATSTNEVKITQTTYDEVYSQDDILRRAVKFVETKLPQFESIKPSSVNVEELTSVIRFTFLYITKDQSSPSSQPTGSSQPSTTRVFVTYTKSTKSFELVESPSQVQETKPILFETTKTDQGRTNYFTNDVTILEKYDSNFDTMFTELTKDIKITSDDIASIQSTKTSTGNTYTITTTKGTEQNQVNAIYNQDTKTVKVIDIQTVESKPVEPTIRTSVVVTKEEYSNNDDITLIIEKSI